MAAIDAGPDDYRFEHPTLSIVMDDMFVPARDLRPGDQVGAFDLPTTDGGHVASAELAADGRPMLLVFGSMTCPVTESGADGLRALHARYGDQVRFVVVNVREAHPGGAIGQPRTTAEKLGHATRLKAHHQLPFEVAVDDLDGTLHRTFGPRPNSAFVIDASGTILFRAQWANQDEAIDEALRAIVAGVAPPAPVVSRTLPAVLRMVGYLDPVLDAAGKGARLDTWKIAAPMGLMALFSRPFFFLPRGRRGLPAMALMMLTLAAAVAVVLSVAR